MTKNRTSWKKGQSGNPSGRPPQGREELRERLAQRSDEVINKTVELALEGDTTALRLVLERLVPPMKASQAPARIEGMLPEGTLRERAEAILQQVAEGRLSVNDGTEMIRALGSVVRVAEYEDLDRRVQELEEQRR
jgi:hypothetical protein